VTPGGRFAYNDTQSKEDRWNSKFLTTATKAARILISSDYHWNLESFCGDFLAPCSIPPTRKKYDPSIPADLAELSIRFFGVGTKRILQTLALSNGLSSPALKSVVPTKIFGAETGFPCAWFGTTPGKTSRAHVPSTTDAELC
jgi:hypothetical protein